MAKEGSVRLAVSLSLVQALVQAAEDGDASSLSATVAMEIPAIVDLGCRFKSGQPPFSTSFVSGSLPTRGRRLIVHPGRYVPLPLRR